MREENRPELWRVCGGGPRLGGLSLFWLAGSLGNPGSFQAESLVGGGLVGRDTARVLLGGEGRLLPSSLIPPATGSMAVEVGRGNDVCVCVCSLASVSV